MAMKQRREAILPASDTFISTIQRAKHFSTHKTLLCSSIYDNDMPEKAREVTVFTGTNLLHKELF